MTTQLTILGSGTTVSSLVRPFDFRHPAGYLLQAAGKNILLDCSEGIRARLEHIQFDYFQLDAVCITHFHPDHFNLDSLLQSLFVRAKRGGVTKKLTIYGPPKIAEHLADFLNRKNDPDFWSLIMPKVLHLEFFEFSDQQPYQLAPGLRLCPYAVAHGNMDAYALRFVIDNKIFAYSGDSGVCAGLVAAAKSAEFFLCEAAYDSSDEIPPVTSHLSPRLAGKVAQNAVAKKLLLTHYTGLDSPTMMQEAVRKSGFAGDIELATDFARFQLN